MNQLSQLREKISNLAKSANHLLVEKGDQVWSTEDQTKFNNLADQITLAKSQVAAIENMRELDAEKFVQTQTASGDPKSIDALAAVALYLRQGDRVTAEQAISIRNAMSTTTAAEGGYTVPSEIAALVIEKLKSFGGMRQFSEIISTSTGQALNFPGSDGTAEVGAIVGQNTAVSTGDMTFTTVALPVFTYTSNKIALPLELVQDSVIDIIGMVVNRLTTRIARKQNSDFTIGGGTTLPDGVMPRAGVGKTGITGQTLTVIYADLVDLKHSVDVAYRAAAKFMLNDLSVAVLSKIVDTTGRPIWAPAITLGAPDTLLGHQVVVNNDVAVMAANARSIAFGDLSKYAIRDVANSTSIRRFDDSGFALQNQVGFAGWQRSGGNLLDTAAVKVYVNSAT